MPDRTPPRLGMLAAHFEFTAKHRSACAKVCVRVDGVTKWLEFYWLNFWTGISRRLSDQKANALSSA
jgi:hypothetical protein